MNRNDNWDDLRFLLCVARHGSVSAAARALGVNHATVLRRVAAVEERTGLSIFEKSLSGYKVGAAHAKLISALEDVEQSVTAFDRLVKGAQAPLRGLVRLTATDTFCHALLPEILGALHKASDGLRIELISSNQHLDLARLDADLSVRVTDRLPDDLDGVQAGLLGFGAFRAKGQALANWIGLAGPLQRSKPALWMADHVDPARIVAAADSFLTVQAMVSSGLGMAILPAFLGDGDPGLERIAGPLEVAPVPVWVAAHKDLAHVPRIQAARKFVTEALFERADHLRGAPV